MKFIKACQQLLLVTATVLGLSACTGLPDNVTPVDDFELNRYLGQWHEIARLDHSFERGLNQISATYTLREDGGVRVLNRGFDIAKGEWRTAEGKAYFADEADIGHLKVSFFGPFYGSYVVFELDDDYQYAFVSGYDHKWLWLLARTPSVSDELKQHFIKRSAELGFDSSQLIWVEQAP
ncbi:lipocalin family protein [Ferrimonas senticii]|uniref:lipocalin family protein n=1 Tax=Ferrimonas senticii TaxID=394566 RepID=UPI00041AFB64|nr:lipocalin family protein [Ferrimonas senticii]